MAVSSSGGNSTSTTVPIICTTLPLAIETSVLFRGSESLGAAGDVEQLLGNRVLARLVVGQGKVLHHVIGGVGRPAHRYHPRRLLARALLQDHLVDLPLNVPRQELREELPRRWLIDILQRTGGRPSGP